MGKNLSFLLLLSLVTTPTNANEVFTYGSLQTLIVENKITTVDSLIKALPSKMKSNPLLAYKSRGLHAASASFQTPRMIFFNDDSSLILSASPYPGDTQIANGNDSLEILKVNPVSNRFETVTMVMNGKQTPFIDSVPVINDKVCLACHGTNPRPIFNEYNAWPGFYGSFGTKGVAVTGTKEFDGLTAFLKNYKGQPRYAELNLDGIYNHEKGLAYPIRDSEFEQYKFSTNMVFGILIERRMHDRTAAKLTNRGEFDRLFPLFYYLGEEANRCGQPYDRVRKVFDALAGVSTVNAAVAIIKQIARQVLTDVEDKDLRLNENNYASRFVDSRGVTAIPFTEMILGVSPTGKTDKDGFEKQMTILETMFSSLGFDETDLSTTPGHPTTGIFHLSRIGGLVIDEQYFQNLLRGFKNVTPAKVAEMDAMPCESVSELALKQIKEFKIPVSAKGILYRN